MSKANQFFETLKRDVLLRVATGAPAKVLKYNKQTQRADIQPLFLVGTRSGDLYKQSVIEDVPVPDHLTAIPEFENHNDSAIRAYSKARELKEGDRVIYVVAQRSLDNLDGTNFIDPDSRDLMSSNDAIIVGRF